MYNRYNEFNTYNDLYAYNKYNMYNRYNQLGLFLRLEAHIPEHVVDQMNDVLV